jgi:hypothetical protein
VISRGQLVERPDRIEQRDSAARDDAFLDRRAGRVHRVVDAILALLTSTSVAPFRSFPAPPAGLTGYARELEPAAMAHRVDRQETAPNPVRELAG